MWHTNYQRYARVNPAFVRQVRLGRSWPMNIALLAAGVVVILPLLALLLAAITVGVLAFVLVSLIAKAQHGLARLFGAGSRVRVPGKTGGPGKDGRENVRVVDR